MKRLIFLFIIFSFLLSACNLNGNTPAVETIVPEDTPTLPSPMVSRDDLPNVEELANEYFHHWVAEDENGIFPTFIQFA
jgi:hypothetical protein